MTQGVGLITGANGKIKVNNVTLGYATSLNLSTRVDMIPGETMGRYEVVSNEPIAYSTNGSFTMLRYTEGGVKAGLPGVNKTSESNSIGAIGLSGQVNPSAILNSGTFEVEVYQKTSGDPKSLQIFKVSNCRITSRSGGVNKRGIYEETFNFVGIISEDDRLSVVKQSSATGAIII
jgi:hypothetical protein